MMASACGVILRLRPLTETSLIVNWLTPEFGRLATVAKGARRSKSAFAGKLDLFYEAEFTFRRSRRSELHTLCELGSCAAHAELRYDLNWLRQVAYAAALIEQTTEVETPLPDIHSLFTDFLKHLPDSPPRSRVVLAFELRLLRILGLEPNIPEVNLAPDCQELIAELASAPWQTLASLPVTVPQANSVQRFLHGFLIYHLGRLPKGRASALGSGQ